MSYWREYHKSMARSISASLAAFGLLFSWTVFAAPAAAQINGVPASVTSPGFGGRAINGTAPSVTSLGPRGVVSTGKGFVPFVNAPFRDHDRDRDRVHRHRRGDVFPFYGYGAVYGVPVPYAYDNYSDDESESADYQGGPTIFDRRGSGPDSYVPPVRNIEPAHVAQNAEPASSADETPSVPTLLVFKDGHQLEVGNYAIVGQVLYDLTPGHTRKVPLTDIDVNATQEQNENRGVNFQLPVGSPTA